MTKKLYLPKIFIITILAMCTCICPSTSLLGHTHSSDFTGVAKTAIPAVVSIRVKGSVKTNTDHFQKWSFPNDGDLFGGNDFFRQFFGIPKGGITETPTEAQASGFIVTTDGYILTNCHVVKDFNEITVVLNDGSEYSGTVVGQDSNTDIAVVKIDATDLPYISLGNSDDLQVGQWAIAIGNPMGLQATLTVGVISATGRNNIDVARIEDFIQTDAAINKGNSGGPLLNLDGEVIGMNTAIFTESCGGYIGIGFAIPSNMLNTIMNDLIANGKVDRGYLGIVLQQMNNTLAKAFNLDKSEGALIAEVNRNSPADKAGLKPGDIILQYGNVQISNISSLRNAIALMKPGSQITLTVIREGNTLVIPVTIGSFPDGSQPLAAASTKGNKYGFSVEDLTPDLAKSLGTDEDSGVVITHVANNSPASWAGLKKGNIIMAIHQKKVHSAAEFNKLVDAIPERGRPILLLVKQGDATRFVSLQLK